MGRHVDPCALEHSLAYLLKVPLIYQIPHLFHSLIHGRKLHLANIHVWLKTCLILHGIVAIHAMYGTRSTLAVE